MLPSLGKVYPMHKEATTNGALEPSHNQVVNMQKVCTKAATSDLSHVYLSPEESASIAIWSDTLHPPPQQTNITTQIIFLSRRIITQYQLLIRPGLHRNNVKRHMWTILIIYKSDIFILHSPLKQGPLEKDSSSMQVHVLE